MLGYTIAATTSTATHLTDIAIGAPMAGAPGKSGGGAVYVVFGSRNPAERRHDDALGRRPDQRPRQPGDLDVGSRYDGFQQNSHTGMALAALPDVNGDGFNDLAVGAPDADLHVAGGGGVAVLYGKAQGVHITLNDLWEKAYPYFFHVDYPDSDDPATGHVAMVDQHAGASVASVGDMTGDGLPDIAIGAPQADFNGTDSGSVWIISAHIAPIVGCTQACPGAASAPGSSSTTSRPGRATASTAPRPAIELGTVARGRRRSERRRHPRPRDRRGGRVAERARRRRSGRRRARARRARRRATWP